MNIAKGRFHPMPNNLRKKTDIYIVPIFFALTMFLFLTPLSLWFPRVGVNMVRFIVAIFFFLYGLKKIQNPFIWFKNLHFVAKSAMSMMVFWVIYGCFLTLFVSDRTGAIYELTLLVHAFVMVLTYLMLCDGAEKLNQIYMCLEVLLIASCIISIMQIIFALHLPASALSYPEYLEKLQSWHWQEIFIPTGFFYNRNGNALLLALLLSIPYGKLLHGSSTKKRKVVCYVELLLAMLILGFINSTICFIAFVFMLLVGTIIRKKYKYLAIPLIAAIFYVSMAAPLRDYHNYVAIRVLKNPAFSNVFLERARELSGVFPGDTSTSTSTSTSNVMPPVSTTADLSNKINFSSPVRVDLLKAGWEMLLKSNFVGVGPNAYKNNIPDVFYEKYGLAAPHAWPMEILSQYGLPVFLFFGFVSFIILQSLIKLSQKGTVETIALLFFLGYYPGSFVGSGAISDLLLWTVFSVFLCAASILPENAKRAEADEKSGKTRVLVVSEGYPSERYSLNGVFAYDQAKALAAAGCDIILACVDLRSIRRIRKWGYEHIVRDHMNIYAINIPLGPVPQRLLAFIGRLALNGLYRKIEREQGRPDVIHAHFYLNAYMALDVKKLTDCPLVITEHSSGVLKENMPASNRRMIGKSYACANALIAVSNSLAKEMACGFGVVPVVIPNLVRTDIFSYQLSKEKQIPAVVSTGNLIKSKGMDILIYAFSKLIKTYPDAKLTIIGGGPEWDKLKNMIEQLDISESVTLTGQIPREEIARHFARSDYFVLASRFETFGVVYIEAMASGMPVIATKCGGPEDFVNESCGMIVPLDDVDALADAMLEMTANLSQYNPIEISLNIVQKCSPEAVAQEILRVYEYSCSTESPNPILPPMNTPPNVEHSDRAN